MKKNNAIKFLLHVKLNINNYYLTLITASYIYPSIAERQHVDVAVDTYK
jgi:hypothetical protein